MEFEKTSEQEIVESANRVLSAAEDTAALSWERVRGIGLRLQTDSFDDESAELGRELVSIAQTNMTLGKRLKAVFDVQADAAEDAGLWPFEPELSDKAFEVVSDSFLRGALNRMVASEGGASMDSGEINQLIERFASHGQWNMPGQAAQQADDAAQAADARSDFDATGQIVFDIEFDGPIEEADVPIEEEADEADEADGTEKAEDSDVVADTEEAEKAADVEDAKETEEAFEPPACDVEPEAEPDVELVSEFTAPLTFSYEYRDGGMRLKQQES